MKNYRKILLCVLIVIFFITIISIFKPAFLLSTKFVLILESENLNNLLLLADISITIFLFFMQDIEKKKSAVMLFQLSTSTMEPGVDSCVSISPWVYQLVRPGESMSVEPYFFVQAYQDAHAKCALQIPIEATIISKTDGKSVVLSDLDIGYMSSVNNMEIFRLSESFPNEFLRLDKPYQSGAKIFVCFSLLLNEERNNAIRNKVLCIKCTVHFTNIYGQIIKQNIQFKIFNSEFGLRFRSLGRA